MRIRSITFFMHPRWPLSELAFQRAGIFTQDAKQVFSASGYQVQSIRLATPPFPEFLSPDAYASAAAQLEMLAHSEGFDYAALGPALPDQLASYAAIPEILANSQNLFFSGHMTTPEGKLSLPAIRACAEVIHQAATIEKNGFANLRFAALANVPPHTPFFPAAYHQGISAGFGLALESADLAVSAFSEAVSLADARSRLIHSIESHAQKLTETGEKLAKTYSVDFKGLDFSLAPFPRYEISIGYALEKLGLSALGLSGSLAAAAFLMDALDQADFKRTGFNGLMLPVLEDSTLAQRGAEGVLGVTDMLLYSSVCGTGLDTVPLPGDASVEQIQAVLLDVAALSSRLAKPLTARLMPIPGKAAGDETGFDFEFFANSRVLALPAQPLSGLLKGDETFSIQPRAKQA